jgi:hypothetical protein
MRSGPSARLKMSAWANDLSGQASLRRAIGKFISRYHAERNYQGLANQLNPAKTQDMANNGTIYRRQGLAGMLNYYYRAAA